MRLAGKRCLVVGGTSGIGRAAVERFRAEGAQVVIGDLDDRGDAGVIRVDAADPAAVDHLFAVAIERLGGLDVLFHVAGASGRKHGDGPLHECTADAWDWTLAANLRSTFLTNRAAVRHFLSERRPGVILNTTTVLAFAPATRHFDTAAYAAAKAGVIGLTRQAAARYAADGIRVNALAPGLIDTPMAERAVYDPAIAAFVRAKQPLAGGPGLPTDVADAAVFLCSDESRLITGAVLAVDGGWSVCDGPYDG
ncbi:MAG TPA: SDR family oxidoreductase [Gemmataceae bacterium]|jgi:NAD(P)-dependent dehydrogenase (short-subunit alcohol dehydrogenase family)